jgi:two-component system chemotaxis sensor kinase CheA
MDELLTQFLIEGPELVQQGSDALLELERDPDDRAAVDQAFRAVHTLKGSVGLFELPAMAKVLHAAEDLLSAVRDGRRRIDAATVDQLLAVLAQTERWLDAIKAEGGLGRAAEAIAERIARGLTGAATAEAVPAALGAEVPAWAERLAAAALGIEGGAAIAIRYTPRPDCYFAGDDPIAIAAAVPGLAHLELGLVPVDGAAPYDPFLCRLRIEAISTAPMEAVRKAFRYVPDQVSLWAVSLAPEAGETKPGGPPPRERDGADLRTLRVPADRLDDLAGLVEELVVANTGLGSFARQLGAETAAGRTAEEVAAHAAQLDRLLARLHRGVMGLRMVPVAPLLRRFPRVAREMAAALDKAVELVIEDSAIEADKDVVEGLFEPLTHLLRNAVDHGVETPEARLAQGKPARGRIVLGADQAGGEMRIRIRDDGQGIDPERLRASARDRKLVGPDRLRALTDQEALELIFLPGFSTAGRVTSLSGRGVGMDAVRAAIMRMGGKVTVASEIGVGTTVELAVPLRITLTKVMVVSEAGERYGLPMERVLETVRVLADRVTPIRAGHAFTWRNKAIPLLPLGALTRGALTRGALTGEAPADGAAEAHRDDRKVLVVRAASQLFGLSVDRIDDRLDVAMRPLDGLLTGLPGVAGTTLLGDGQVLMILEPEALIG